MSLELIPVQCSKCGKEVYILAAHVQYNKPLCSKCSKELDIEMIENERSETNE